MYFNINENYGDMVTFETLNDMEEAIVECGYELPIDGLREGIDYEEISQPMSVENMSRDTLLQKI